MRIIFGKVCRFLYSPDGDATGFMIDDGLEIYFPPSYSRQVLSTLSVGSHAGICGLPCSASAPGSALDATYLANLDSQRSVNLEQQSPPDEPEVPAVTTSTPGLPTPLAPFHHESDANIRLRVENSQLTESVPTYRYDRESQPLRESRPPAACSHRSNSEEAVETIERAFRRLHHTQALLAYLKILNLECLDIGELLDESKRAYQKAIANYEGKMYCVASEYALASSELSRTVEILIGRTMSCDSRCPTIVSPPPMHSSPYSGLVNAPSNFAKVELMLSRIRWVIQNGTLRSDDREQVSKIAARSEQLADEARRLVDTSPDGVSSEILKAAEAAVLAAEHLCKQSYVTHEPLEKAAATHPSRSK